MNPEPVTLRAVRHRATPIAPSVLDEAFAATTDADLRADASHSGRSTSDAAPSAAELGPLVRAELASLDAQRERLNRLLEGIANEAVDRPGVTPIS